MPHFFSGAWKSQPYFNPNSFRKATSVYSFILLNHMGFSPKNKKQENDLSLAYPEYISIKQEESQAWVEIEIPSLKPIKVWALRPQAFNSFMMLACFLLTNGLLTTCPDSCVRDAIKAKALKFLKKTNLILYACLLLFGHKPIPYPVRQ